MLKRYLRDNNVLLCSKEFASASRWFFQFNDKIEAKILYSLAQPECIRYDSLIITEDYRLDEIVAILKEWAYSSVLFEALDELYKKFADFSIEVIKDTYQKYINPNFSVVSCFITLVNP